MPCLERHIAHSTANFDRKGFLPNPVLFVTNLQVEQFGKQAPIQRAGQVSKSAAKYSLALAQETNLLPFFTAASRVWRRLCLPCLQCRLLLHQRRDAGHHGRHLHHLIACTWVGYRYCRYWTAGKSVSACVVRVVMQDRSVGRTAC